MNSAVVEIRNTFIHVRPSSEMYDTQRRPRSLSCPPLTHLASDNAEITSEWRRTSYSAGDARDRFSTPSNGISNNFRILGSEGLTTVMLRDLPLKYTHELLWVFMETCGFTGTYDFIYLPTDFVRGTNMGYGFINFKTSHYAKTFMSSVNGVRLPFSGNSSKQCTCCWARIQGYDANIAHVAKSALKNLPGNVRPIILNPSGVRIPFICHGGEKTISPRKFSKEARKSGQEDPRKIFIGGIREGVTEESMRAAILNCMPSGSDVLDCSIVRDCRNGKNRGFGFVTFDSHETSAFVLDKYSTGASPLSIDGHVVSVKPYMVV